MRLESLGARRGRRRGSPSLKWCSLALLVLLWGGFFVMMVERPKGRAAATAAAGVLPVVEPSKKKATTATELPTMTSTTAPPLVVQQPLTAAETMSPPPRRTWQASPGLPRELKRGLHVLFTDGSGLCVGHQLLEPFAVAMSGEEGLTQDSCVFQVVEGSGVRDGFVALRAVVGNTYLGVNPDGTFVADKIAPRSMEHFRLERVGAAVRVSPQGQPSRCARFSGWGLMLGDCSGPDSLLAVQSVEGAIPASFAGATRLPEVDSRLVFGTTAWKPLSSPRTIRVLRAWLGIPRARVVVCLEDIEEAAGLRAALGEGAVVRSDCETHEVDGRPLPTYRGIFAAAEAVASKQDVVVFANADIIFDGRKLQHMADAMAAIRARSPSTHVFTTGRRLNCQPPKGSLNEAVPVASWLAGSAARDVFEEAKAFVALKQRCELFGDDAQDFFAATVHAFAWGPPSVDVADAASSYGLPPDRVVHGRSFRSLVEVPPLVVGGIAFDNFIVSQANKRPDVVSIDATAAVDAFHINHGTDVRASHHKPSSIFNSKLAHESGGWNRGKTSVAEYTALPSNGAVIVAVRKQLRRRLGPDGVPKRMPLFHDSVALTDPPDAFSRPWQRPD